MQTTIRELKAQLRVEVLERLNQMTPHARIVGSEQARALLERQPLWKAAQSILFFAPMPEEVDVWPLLIDALSQHKLVALPRFVAERRHYTACQVQNLDSDLKTGHFGIREPASHCLPLPLNRLDLILVPGVAFDPRGRRLGRGKGYYDRLLATLRGVTCGVAFDEQIVHEIPVAPHDVHVDCILTPTRWMSLPQRAVLE